jgi:hypothetical protein
MPLILTFCVTFSGNLQQRYLRFGAESPERRNVCLGESVWIEF